MSLTTTASERCRQGLYIQLCRPKTQGWPLLVHGSSFHRIRLCPWSRLGQASPRGPRAPVETSGLWWLCGCVAGAPVVAVVLGSPAQPAPTSSFGAGGAGLARACCIPWAGRNRRLGLCVLLAGGSLSCCIDPQRGRNMCAMHRSMGRLKMHVRLPDGWGKLCRWHWQHSEGHADLRRSPRGEARPLVALMGGCLITCPPETLDFLPGTHLLSRALSAGGGVPSAGLALGTGRWCFPHHCATRQCHRGLLDL